MKKGLRRVLSVFLALAMVFLGLPEYVAPMKTAKAADIKKFLYVRTTEMKNDGKYLIVASDNDGHYALSHNGTSATVINVTVNNASSDEDASDAYIVPTDSVDSAAWETKTENDLMKLVSGDYYLQITGGNNGSNRRLTISHGEYVSQYNDYDKSFNWTYDSSDKYLKTTYHTLWNGYAMPEVTSYLGFNSTGSSKSFVPLGSGYTIEIYKYTDFTKHEYKYQSTDWVFNADNSAVIEAVAHFKCDNCDATHDVIIDTTSVAKDQINECLKVPQWSYSATIPADEKIGIPETEVNKTVNKQVVDEENSTKQKVYILTNEVKAGNNYLIVSSNVASATQAHALSNGTSSQWDMVCADQTVEIKSGKLTINGVTSSDEKVYVSEPGNRAVWKVTTNDNARYPGLSFSNSGWNNTELRLYHLTENGSFRRIYMANSGEMRYCSWNTDSNTMFFKNSTTSDNIYYLRCNVRGNNTATWGGEANPDANQMPKVYFYVETEIETNLAYKDAPANGHLATLKFEEKVEATCVDSGHEEGYYCSKCQKYYTTSEGTTVVENWKIDVNPDAHDWKFVVASEDNAFVWNTAGDTYTAEALYTCRNTENETDESKKHNTSVAATVAGPELVEGNWVYTATIAKDDDLETGENQKERIDYYRVPAEYTVTWNIEGTKTTATIGYNDTPAYTGTPTKASNGEYEYTFIGWKINGQGDATQTLPAPSEWSEGATAIEFVAEFSETAIPYTVYWIINEDDNDPKSSVGYNETPKYPEEGTPSINNDDENVQYTFEGWKIEGDETETVYGANDDLPTPKEWAELVVDTAEIRFIAVFTTSYKITWLGDNDVVLKSEFVEEGETPAYTDNDPKPTKAATKQYTYTFDGWNETIVAATEPATYTAKFASTINKYTITWLDGNGNTLKTEQVEYGETPKYTGDTPTMKETAECTYTFNEKWTPEIVAVDGEATYKALFDSTTKKYTVKFVNDDETVLQSGEVEYGATPKYDGKEPTKAADKQYTYTFDEWTPEISTVEKEITYTATYTKAVNKYTITWKNGDTTLKSEQVEYGKTPAYDGAEPTKAKDDKYEYKFNGWEPTIAAVSGDATYSATFTQTEIKQEETQPEETKPEETKPEETKPEETKPEETKPEETKPEETKPEEAKPEETKPEETKPVVKLIYKYVGPANPNHVKGSGESLPLHIKCTTDDSGTYNKCTGVKVGNNPLKESIHYFKKFGSVIIDLKPEYLETLPVGKTIITVSFIDGDDVNIEIEILPAKEAETKTDEKPVGPKTGDTINMTLLMILMGFALATVTFAIWKKRELEARCDR